MSFHVIFVKNSDEGVVLRTALLIRRSLSLTPPHPSLGQKARSSATSPPLGRGEGFIYSFEGYMSISRLSLRYYLLGFLFKHIGSAEAKGSC